MNSLSITIPGPPIAKKRPRFVRRGKFVSAYNPQETEEGRWLWDATLQLGPDFGIIMVPLELSLSFHMPIPASMSKKARAVAIYHTKKPDVDNCVKFVLDCLNGVLYRDDCLIYKIEAVKLYSHDPRTVISAMW